MEYGKNKNMEYIDVGQYIPYFFVYEVNIILICDNQIHSKVPIKWVEYE